MLCSTLIFCMKNQTRKLKKNSNWESVNFDNQIIYIFILFILSSFEMCQNLKKCDFFTRLLTWHILKNENKNRKQMICQRHHWLSWLDSHISTAMKYYSAGKFR